jgi:hypothetical protein
MQHRPVAERLCEFYPDIDKIYSIHSEIIELENPIKHPSIKKYIAIRPEIKDFIVNNFDVSEDIIEIIYNPVDNEKFKNKNTEIKESVLFVGTIDYLRRETIMDLIEYSKQSNKEFWLMGEDKNNYLPSLLLNSHVKYFEPSWEVEKTIICSPSVSSRARLTLALSASSVRPPAAKTASTSLAPIGNWYIPGDLTSPTT